MSETAESPRCARCGCTPGEHHKLHCEGRNGNCMCSGGWADPGTPLTAFDEVCQAENAEYDAVQAEMRGRTIEVTTASHGQVPLHLSGGTGPLTEQDKTALAALAEAAINRTNREHPHLGVVQELAMASFHARVVLREHGRDDLADRLAAAVQGARDALAGGPS